MAELAVGGPQADDLFSLGGNYKAQSSSSDATKQVATAANDVGDVIASDTHGAMTSVSVEYVYNSTSPMYNSSSTNAAHKTLPRPGTVLNGYMVTQVDVAYEATSRPKVTVTGHAHGANTHNTDGAIFTPTLIVSGGFGCPGLFTNTDTDGSSAPKSETFSISCEHVEADDGTGNHIAGANYGGKETYSSEWVGAPTLTVPAGWKRTSAKSNTANTEFDSQNHEYEHHIART